MSASSTAEDPTPILDALVREVRAIRYEDLPEGVVRKAKLIIQHNLVVALAACDLDVPGQDRAEWPADSPPFATATRLTDGRRSPTIDAIVTNSLLMGARAQHDEHQGAVVHLGSTVLPPLLAAAEQASFDGRTLIRALVLGYEVGARIGESAIELSRRGFRPTSQFGPFAGAASLSIALGLTQDQMVSALALAANAACGVAQTWIAGTDEWRYQTALAARDGFTSAHLARLGVRGAADSLEGHKGLLTVHGITNDFRPQILSNIGISWSVDDILLKPYPICAFNQAPVQQLLTLLARAGVKAGAVARVTVHMNETDAQYPGVAGMNPATAAAALMSVRTCAAIAVLDGEMSRDRLAACTAADIVAMSERVELRAHSDIPTHWTRVDVECLNGQQISSGPAASTKYDEDTAKELVASLAPLTRLSPTAVGNLVSLISVLDEVQRAADLVSLATVE